MKILFILLCVALIAGHASAQNTRTKSEKKTDAAADEMYVDEINEQQSAIQREKAASEASQKNPGQIYSKEDDQRQEEDIKKGR